MWSISATAFFVYHVAKYGDGVIGRIDIHDFFFFWPTYRPKFLASMIRETKNQIGVALKHIFVKITCNFKFMLFFFGGGGHAPCPPMSIRMVC